MVGKGPPYVIISEKTGVSESSRFSPHRWVLNYSERCKVAVLKDVDSSKIRQKDRARANYSRIARTVEIMRTSNFLLLKTGGLVFRKTRERLRTVAIRGIPP